MKSCSKMLKRSPFTVENITRGNFITNPYIKIQLIKERFKLEKPTLLGETFSRPSSNEINTSRKKLRNERQEIR